MEIKEEKDYLRIGSDDPILIHLKPGKRGKCHHNSIQIIIMDLNSNCFKFDYCPKCNHILTDFDDISI